MRGWCSARRFAGMLWNKQFYALDVYRWLRGDPTLPAPPAGRKRGRNHDWRHMNADDVISMPDKWEYPWFAAWDLAFHCVTFALLDRAFAKDQLLLLSRKRYMHPNGQMPGVRVGLRRRQPAGAGLGGLAGVPDRAGADRPGRSRLPGADLPQAAAELRLVGEPQGHQGRNVFQGGFLGLDNIGVFDRSRPLPTGGYLDQADGTAWMAMYALNMMRIALELAMDDRAFEDIASKFFEHFLYIAQAINDIGERGVGLWSETDKFFHDVLNLPDGSMRELKLRSMVGLTPLFVVETLEPDMLKRLPNFSRRLHLFLSRRPDLAGLVARWDEPGIGERRLLSLLRGHRMKRLLLRVLDPDEFLSDHGVRSLSRFHEANPYVFENDGARIHVAYEPGESRTEMFGGNSNWRGPIWFPMNFLIVEALDRFHDYYGRDFLVECPTASGRFRTLRDIADDIAGRLSSLFLRGADGRRPIYGDCETQQSDPHFANLILFHEYFHGDSGKGLGASHQTGWTGLVANLIARRAKARE